MLCRIQVITECVLQEADLRLFAPQALCILYSHRSACDGQGKRPARYQHSLYLHLTKLMKGFLIDLM
jgi:hypothetical protein